MWFTILSICGYFMYLAVATSDEAGLEWLMEDETEVIYRPEATHYSRWCTEDDPEWDICQP